MIQANFKFYNMMVSTRIDWFLVYNATFSYIMATSFSGGRSQNTWREPPTMGKQLVNFITCGCKSSAPFLVIYKAGHELTLSQGLRWIQDVYVFVSCWLGKCAALYICVSSLLKASTLNLFFNLFKDGYLKLSKTYIFK